jgi:hypothetical protein
LRGWPNEPNRAFDFDRPSHALGTCVSTTKGEFRHARFDVAAPEMQERYRNAPGLDKEETGACSPPQVPMP